MIHDMTDSTDLTHENSLNPPSPISRILFPYLVRCLFFRSLSASFFSLDHNVMYHFCL